MTINQALDQMLSIEEARGEGGPLPFPSCLPLLRTQEFLSPLDWASVCLALGCFGVACVLPVCSPDVHARGVCLLPSLHSLRAAHVRGPAWFIGSFRRGLPVLV